MESKSRLLGLFVAAILVTGSAGCGGTTRTVTVQGTSAPTTTSVGSAPSDHQVKVEQARMIYLPDQTGGHFHTILVLLRNDSDQTAVDVGGQISILDEHGTLVQSIEPTPTTILPHGEGVWLEDADLPKPLPSGKVKTQVAVSHFDPGGRSPVSFSNLRYRRMSFGGCAISGTVSNRFTERKANLQIRVAGFVGSKLATGESTYANGPTTESFQRRTRPSKPTSTGPRCALVGSAESRFSPI